MSATINPADPNAVFLLPFSFDNGVFHVLIENWTLIPPGSSHASLGCLLSTHETVSDAASAFCFLRSALSIPTTAGEVLEPEASVLSTGNNHVFLVLLPPSWAQSVKSSPSPASASHSIRPKRLWIPLLEVLTMSTDLNAMAAPHRPVHLDDHRDRPHFFHSDPPMSRYLSQIPHEKPVSELESASSSSSSTTAEGHSSEPQISTPKVPHRFPHGDDTSAHERVHEEDHGQVLHPRFSEVIQDSQTISLIHDLLVRFHPPSRTIRNPSTLVPIDLGKLDASVVADAKVDWTWRGAVWDRLVQHRSQQKQPGSHESVRDINHLENQLTREAEEAAGVNRQVTGPAYLRHMNGFCEILLGLFLTNIAASNDIKKLQEKGVTHILRVVPTRINYPTHFIHGVIPVEDVEESDLLRAFEAAKLFIDAGRRSGGCLVHCMAGVSRSTTIVLSYVMTEVFKNDSHCFLKSFFQTFNKRSVICPNDGFLLQLVTYESLIKTSEYEQTPIFKFLRQIRDPRLHQEN